jgi:hypothetical protein
MGTALDTVIAHYFLLSDEFELLLRLLDPPVVVPSIVFDPDEKGSAAAAQSELRRAIAYEQRRAKDVTSDEDDRKLASANVRRLEAVIGYVRRGQLQVVDMTSDEYDLYNELTTASSPPEGLIVALGPGEAACLAIALRRGYVFATDDTDALRILERRAPGHPYERIRKLLIRAAEEGLIDRRRANAIHEQMRMLGFWDTQPPFPRDRD